MSLSSFLSQQDYVMIIEQLQRELETARQEAATASEALSSATLGFLSTTKIISDQLFRFKEEVDKVQEREKRLWADVTYPPLPQKTKKISGHSVESSERRLSTMFDELLERDELFQSYNQGLKRVEASYKELEELREHFGKSIPAPYSSQFHDPSGYWMKMVDKKEKKKERIVFGGDGVIRYFTNGTLGKHKIAIEEVYPFYPHPSSPNTVCMVWLQNLRTGALDSHLSKDPNTKSYLVTFTITAKDKMTIQRPVRSTYDSGMESWTFVPGNVEAEESTNGM